MAGFAFDDYQCMFFVGGNDVKTNNGGTGSSVAGGCLKSWWLDQLGGLVPGDAGYDAAGIVAMGKLMTTDGSSIYTEMDAEVAGFGDNSVFFEGNFAGIEVGMLIWCDEIDPVFVNGDGIYLIAEVAGDNSYIRVDGETAVGINAGNKANLYIGGAHSSIDTVAQEISAENYSQEIFCNKDYAPQNWTLSEWGYGDETKNTWLRVRGFNRVPHDITDYRGSSYASTKEAEDYGADPPTESFVNLDLENDASTFMVPDLGENIQISGFRTYNQASTNYVFRRAASAYSNIEISHNAFKMSSHLLYLGSGSNILIWDNYFYPAGALASKWVLEMASDTRVCVAFNRFNFRDNTVNMYQGSADSVFSFGNYGECDRVTTNITVAGTFHVEAFNTWLNANIGAGLFRINAGTCISLANILMPKVVDNPAFLITGNGGSIVSKNDCVYSEGSGSPARLNAVVVHGVAGGEAGGYEFEIEEDPELDGNGEPLNGNVRQGGPTDMQGDPATIGAIQTMNTAVIEAAVLAAIGSDVALILEDTGTTLDGKINTIDGIVDTLIIMTGTTLNGKVDIIDGIVNAVLEDTGTTLDGKINTIDAVVDIIRAKTDGLNFTGDDVKATLDSELVKLAADGWDGLSIDEPSGDPDGWTVPQKLMWLIMRFLNQHSSDNFNGILVKKSDGSASTAQPVTEGGGVKTVSKAQ